MFSLAATQATSNQISASFYVLSFYDLQALSVTSLSREIVHSIEIDYEADLRRVD